MPRPTNFFIRFARFNRLCERRGAVHGRNNDERSSAARLETMQPYRSAFLGASADVYARFNVLKKWPNAKRK